MSNSQAPHFLASATDHVLVAFGGGQNAALTVRILQDQGFAAEGLFLQLHEGCDAQAALAAAKRMGIPLRVSDAREAFAQEVAAPCAAAWRAGRSPAAAAALATGLILRLTAQSAADLGFEWCAAGVYARLEQDDAGRTLPACALDALRDESDRLYALAPQLPDTLLLPLGELEMADLRAIVRESALGRAPAPAKGEMTVAGLPLAQLLAAQGCAGRAGQLLAPDGSALGPHRGTLHYAVGQRRALPAVEGRPTVVCGITPQGDVCLDFADKALCTHLVLEAPALFCALPPRCLVQTAAGLPAVPAAAQCADGRLELCLDAPLPAPAPGAPALLYDTAGRLLGAGAMA